MTLPSVTNILATLTSQFDVSCFLDVFLDRVLTCTVEQRRLNATDENDDDDERNDVTECCLLLENIIKCITLPESTAKTICG